MRYDYTPVYAVYYTKYGPLNSNNPVDTWSHEHQNIELSYLKSNLDHRWWRYNGHKTKVNCLSFRQISHAKNEIMNLLAHSISFPATNAPFHFLGRSNRSLASAFVLRFHASLHFVRECALSDLVVRLDTVAYYYASGVSYINKTVIRQRKQVQNWECVTFSLAPLVRLWNQCHTSSLPEGHWDILM